MRGLAAQDAERVLHVLSTLRNRLMASGSSPSRRICQAASVSLPSTAVSRSLRSTNGCNSPRLRPLSARRTPKSHAVGTAQYRTGTSQQCLLARLRITTLRAAARVPNSLRPWPTAAEPCSRSLAASSTRSFRALSTQADRAPLLRASSLEEAEGSRRRTTGLQCE